LGFVKSEDTALILPLGQHFNGFFVGRVADQQTEFLQVQEPLCDTGQAGQEKVTDREPGAFACAEYLIEVVNQLFCPVIYNVVSRHVYSFCFIVSASWLIVSSSRFSALV